MPVLGGDIYGRGSTVSLTPEQMYSQTLQREMDSGALMTGNMPLNYQAINPYYQQTRGQMSDYLTSLQNYKQQASQFAREQGVQSLAAQMASQRGMSPSAAGRAMSSGMAGITGQAAQVGAQERLGLLGQQGQAIQALNALDEQQRQAMLQEAALRTQMLTGMSQAETARKQQAQAGKSQLASALIGGAITGLSAGMGAGLFAGGAGAAAGSGGMAGGSYTNYGNYA